MSSLFSNFYVTALINNSFFILQIRLVAAIDMLLAHLKQLAVFPPHINGS